jgi:hypothetical protein
MTVLRLSRPSQPDQHVSTTYALVAPLLELPSRSELLSSRGRIVRHQVLDVERVLRGSIDQLLEHTCLATTHFDCIRETGEHVEDVAAAEHVQSELRGTVSIPLLGPFEAHVVVLETTAQDLDQLVEGQPPDRLGEQVHGVGGR